MKQRIELAWLVLLSMVLCGCCSRAEPTQTNREPLTLRVVTSYGSEDGNRSGYESAVAEYEKKTGVVVEDHSDTSNEEWKARVLADFETGSEPDVLFFFTNADAEPLIRAKEVVSVEEARAEFPDYAGNMNMEKLPVAFDGNHYAVAITGYWEDLYVNKSVLEHGGVPLPAAVF